MLKAAEAGALLGVSARTVYALAKAGLMAQSGKDRQEALRARRLMEGMTEVRGIYLPPDLHATLKAEARKLLKKRPTPPRVSAPL